ncbi:hypothetical protein ABTQ33_00305 [Paucilactobacillus suebicus]|uniref:Uncharacterized protein n=1 Tax=Paucilactobacillus suebicus DSM 5007 = KCTC 3549 TaxID=1423807 RepID=A0A0R1W495_9LACO|nr:hypothetical protein [Paucilactobacillus suebicus]KRM12590.1 hypothetical protein FD16_GL002102 [Paucilactobacillus suebicus DSM 5007 = KCTC 3549]
MEWGPISEWVAAISEFLAVCVALFLPYYNERREQKRKLRNLRITIKRMGEQAIEGDRISSKTLDLVLMISFLNTSSSENEDLIMAGRKIIDLIKHLPEDHQDSTYATQVEQIKALMNEL